MVADTLNNKFVHHTDTETRDKFVVVHHTDTETRDKFVVVHHTDTETTCSLTRSAGQSAQLCQSLSQSSPGLGVGRGRDSSLHSSERDRGVSQCVIVKMNIPPSSHLLCVQPPVHCTQSLTTTDCRDWFTSAGQVALLISVLAVINNTLRCLWLDKGKERPGP